MAGKLVLGDSLLGGETIELTPAQAEPNGFLDLRPLQWGEKAKTAHFVPDADTVVGDHCLLLGDAQFENTDTVAIDPAVGGPLSTCAVGILSHTFNNGGFESRANAVRFVLNPDRSAAQPGVGGIYMWDRVPQMFTYDPDMGQWLEPPSLVVYPFEAQNTPGNPKTDQIIDLNRYNFADKSRAVVFVCSSAPTKSVRLLNTVDKASTHLDVPTYVAPEYQGHPYLVIGQAPGDGAAAIQFL